MSEAFLVLTFDVIEGMPLLLNAGIFSESCNTLTTDLSGNTLLIDGPSATGKDYQEARDQLIEDLKDHPFYRKWVFNYIDLEEEVSLPFWHKQLDYIRTKYSKDKRLSSFLKEYIKEGTYEPERWDLSQTFAKIIYDRLKSWRPSGYPSSLSSSEEWNGILDKITEGFRLIAEEYFQFDLKPEDLRNVKVIEAFDLFKEWYFCLWC